MHMSALHANILASIETRGGDTAFAVDLVIGTILIGEPVGIYSPDAGMPWIDLEVTDVRVKGVDGEQRGMSNDTGKAGHMIGVVWFRGGSQHSINAGDYIGPTSREKAMSYGLTEYDLT